jgi:hypothetical protein
VAFNCPENYLEPAPGLISTGSAPGFVSAFWHWSDDL